MKLLRKLLIGAVLFGSLISGTHADAIKHQHRRQYPVVQSIVKASWYGGKFNGRKTASGERYDMYDLTCAHRTYPMGTLLKVTNINNGKTVVVRVNDRGPFNSRLGIDLSYEAAQELGFSGVAKVRIEKV